MHIGVPKETFPQETRVALVPASAQKLVQLGAQVTVETGLGNNLGFSDESYQKSGAQISDRARLLANSDILIRVRKSGIDEIGLLKKGCIHISFFDPFQDLKLVETFAQNSITVVSLEMMPRTTLAQKMDALSSQASLAGYAAVILAAERSLKIFPMMMTPAGTISPARVFVIGAGVAGLQAIATARRLGARVDAFDTRPEVEEQVASLGAKFVKIDLGEIEKTNDGYARALTAEQLERQRQGMLKVCQQSDVIITTAQVFGRRAPTIITRSMLEHLRPGTVIVDTAIDSGGNVEGAVLGQETTIAGVRILGFGNLPARVAVNASQMYASNVANFIEHFCEKENQKFRLDLNDEILKKCVLTHNGTIVNEILKTRSS